MSQHFQIVGLNELNEPFNSSDILDTPKYVNQNEQVFFFYTSSGTAGEGIELKGDEKWVWDFDYEQVVTDQVKQTIFGFDEPLPVVFSRAGQRKVHVDVYEQIQKRSLKLSTINTVSTGDNPFSFVNNGKTGNLFILNKDDSSITVINSLDQVVKTITLTDNPLFGAYDEVNEKVYVITDNSTTIVIDGTSESVLTTITSSFVGDLKSIESHGTSGFIYTSIDRIGQDKIDVIDTNTDSIISTIDVNLVPTSLTYSEKWNKLFVANNGTNSLTIIDTITNTIDNVISTNTNNPYQIELDETNDYIYVRTDENIEVFDYNSTSFIQTINVGQLTDLSENTTNILQYNSHLNELYTLADISGSKFIQTINVSDFSFNDSKEINLNGTIHGIFYDPSSLTLYHTYDEGSTKQIKAVETPTFDTYYSIDIDNTATNLFKSIQGKIFSNNTVDDNVFIQDVFSNETNLKVDGQIIYTDTITFDVFKFPTSISGLEFAVDTQTINYTTIGSSADAQEYEWFVNGVKQASTINSLNYTFINVVKVLITVNVRNGRTIKQLTFTTKLSQGSAVVGRKYEGNVKDSLLFFNKEGDNLNFEVVEEEDTGLTHWEGDMIFHVNSDDTFKTIGLYTLEKVDPLRFRTEDLYLRKLQMFNQYGIDFQSSINDEIDFTIESIESVNNQSGYYTKWLNAPNIQNSIPIGSEIILKDIYEIAVDNTIPTNPILTNYELIEELNSDSTSGGTDLFTVVGNRRNSIMVISKTSNDLYDKNYGFGDFRLQNNAIQTVPQGKIQIKNIVKVFDPTNFSFDWNEPFYKDLFYDRKKITLLNTQKNDGIYTINYLDDDISKDLNNKVLKINSINIDDLIPDPSLDFQIKLIFKTSKILLSSSSPVDFLPSASDPFLNNRNLVIWESVLDRDYTPPLLKEGVGFSFEQTTPSEINFSQIYKSVKIDTAENILTAQTTDEQDYKLVLKNYDSLAGFTFTFTINKTTINIKEGVEWNRGSSVSDSAQSIAEYLNDDDNILGLSVIAIDDEVWIHTKNTYEIVLNTPIDTNIFQYSQGILKENNPDYGIVGDKWAFLGDSSYNGYIHHRVTQGNFHILYYTGTIGNETANWYTLPLDKKVVWVDPTSTIEYAENLVSDAYLEDNELYFTQKGDITEGTTPEMILERFISENKNTLFGYGLDIYNENNEKFSLARTHTLKDLNPINDYIDIEFLIDSETLLGTSGAVLGTDGTSLVNIDTFVATTSGYIESQNIQNFQVLEDLQEEKNHTFGKYKRDDKVSENFERKIIIKDIDKSFGFVLTINGIDYDVTADDVSFSGVTGDADEILDVQETLFDWGNQKFQLDQDITPEDDSDIGKPYYEILEEQGILVWLEKSEESLVQGIPRYDTITIQSRFPNVNINYSVNGTLDQHKIIHSDVEFIEIGSNLSITINRIPYSVNYQGSIQSTLEEWVETWEATLLEQDIFVDYYQPTIAGTNSSTGLALASTSGTDFYGGGIYDRLRFSTLEENTNFKYSVWVGKNNILGNPFYKIIPYRKGKQGIILSGNEVRINTIDLQDVGFATGMITTLTGSKFPMNNQEYNLIFVDPNILGLSYQGAFWNNNDTLDYHYTRSGFDWELYNEFTYEENLVNGVYSSTAGTYSITTTNDVYWLEYDPINDYMWVSHTNGLSNDVYVIDTEDNSIIETINLGSNINFMKYNQVNRRMYVSNTGSNKVTVINTDDFSIVKTIFTDVSPWYSEVDPYTGYMYVVNQHTDNVHIIDGITNNILTSVGLGDKPTKITFDYHERRMYIINENDNTVNSLSTETNSLVQLINVGGNPVDIVYDDIYKDIYVSSSSSGELTIIDGATSLPSTLFVGTNLSQMDFDSFNKNLYAITDNELVVISNREIISRVSLPHVPSDVKYIPFSSTIFITSSVDNKVMVVKLDEDGFFNIEEILNGGINPTFINWASNNTVYVSNIGGDNVTTYEQIGVFVEPTESTSGETILSLSSREFLRYPRERFDEQDPIQFKLSWEDADVQNPNTDIFFYDFSGEQLFIEKRDKNGELVRINDKGIYNYTGSTPLLDDDDIGYLNTKYNKDLEETTNPARQQTIWEELYYDLNLIDSEDDIDFNPLPMQTFIGYNSKEEGVDSRTLLIERLEYVDLTISTRLKDEQDPSLGWIDILNFNAERMEVSTQNSMVNFIEAGFIIGQKVEIKGRDIVSDKNQATFKNSGFIGIVESVLVNKMTFRPVNKDIKDESSLTTTRGVIPPFRVKETAFEITLTALPTKIARVNVKGQTEIEDERFKVDLNNKGYNINYRDVFIFDDYDIKENGIDWVYVNEKRKEMLTMYPEIYNYLGSYKALVNAINYFGYEEIELYEYYLNIDKDSKFYNKLHKIEIPDIFNNQVEGYTPNDFIIKTLPNNRYQKTRLFNLTYRITDLEGNNILAFSLDEVITKLLGLKKWLRENIMPVGTRIRDLTGRGDTPHNTQIWHDVKFTTKFEVYEDLTIVDYDIEAYQQPVENNAKTYNVHLEFKTNDDKVPDYYQVNVKTFSAKPDFEDPNFIMRTVQNHSWYKTDLEHINFTADRYTDPFILVETIQDNGYGATYTNRRTYSLELLAFLD
jgi:YVTN family beta-propeller protein